MGEREQLIFVEGKPVIVGSNKKPVEQVKRRPEKKSEQKANMIGLKASAGWIIASLEAGALLCFLYLIGAGVI